MNYSIISTIKLGRAHTDGADQFIQNSALRSAFEYFSLQPSDTEIDKCLELICEPDKMEGALLKVFSSVASSIRVTGSIDTRVLLVFTAHNSGVIVSLSESIEQIDFANSNNLKIVEYLGPRLALFTMSETQLLRLNHPTIMLIGLYHPETFPLPRFHLGISDLARELRSRWIGKVTMYDMQLGLGLDDIKDLILKNNPEIVGISVTFGQYDLLVDLLEFLNSPTLRTKPVIVAGGSLAAHLQSHLLESALLDFVSVGAGEGAIVGIAKYVLGELPIESIPDTAYMTNETLVHTNRVSNKNERDIMPELDLLDATLASFGVMQLESSRGCSYACSFCPRSHKGIWAGEHSSSLKALMPYIAKIFTKYPDIAKRIFLVDEEFVGYQTDDLALGRCQEVAEAITSFGFSFETSSRIDQVYRPRKNRDWHLQRMEFWLSLSKNGMQRCLFGVESGVNSILKRFNKKTTAIQNVIAVRILSLLEIPIRYTYITFDPLMSMAELNESLFFLERTDLILKRPASIQLSDYRSILDIALSDEASTLCSIDVPFYYKVSYLGVSMEALIGSPYLKSLEAAGLAGATNPLMGRKESIYIDKKIGQVSAVSQRWIDQNFALDYTLKSIQKRVSASAAESIGNGRVLLKKFCHSFIVNCLNCVISKSGLMDENEAEKLLNSEFSYMEPLISEAIIEICPQLSIVDSEILIRQLSIWRHPSDWRLINGQCD